MIYRSILEAVTAYHGTSSVFKAFRFEKSATHPSKIGVWFASTPEAAQHMAGLSQRSADAVPRVIKAYLRLEQPIVYQTYADFLAAYRDAGSDSAKLRKRLIKQGYDGIEITHSETDGAGMRTDWAVFHPYQIDQ